MAKTKQGFELPEIEKADAVKILGGLTALLEASIDAAMADKEVSPAERAAAIADHLVEIAAVRLGAAVLIASI